MSALPYLFVTKLKNTFRQLLQKPARLIYLVFMLALVVFVFWSGNLGGDEASATSDPRELAAIITAYYTLMFALTAKTGFSRGGTIFSLPDVNLVFTSPIRPARTLLYGLTSQLGVSLLMGLLILFQYSWINQSYGVTIPQVLILVLGYAVVIFCAQLFAMLVYSFTSGRETLRNILKWVFYGIIAVYVIAILGYGYFAASGDMNQILPNVVTATNTLAVKLFPFTGWFGGIFLDYYSGTSSFLFPGILLFVLYFVGSVLAVIFFKHDYYEDVLQTAEYNYSAIVARKEGTVTEALPEKIKVGKIGFTNGDGASAFYYKHRIENRRSKRAILSPVEIVFVLVSVGFAFIMSRSIPSSSAVLWMSVGFSVYMQIFTAALGRLPKELAKPYIYLIPENSFKKLFNAVKDGLPGYAVTAVLVMVPIGLMLNLPPLEIPLIVLVHITFSFLLLALNILSQRIFGSGKSGAYTLLFYFLLLIVMVTPGIAAAIFFGILTASPVLIPALMMILLNTLISALILFLCRNMLQYAEAGQLIINNGGLPK